MSLFDLKVSELRDLTASGAPTPGGGSVACVTATLGLGLVVMAVEITSKGGADAPTREWLEHARRKLADLSAQADRDVREFDHYMRAYAMPRATEEEKATRKAAMQSALGACTECPLAAGEDMLGALELAKATVPRVKRSVLSDVLAGADLLQGSVAAVLRNVDVNLRSLADEARGRELAARRAGVETRGRELRDEIVEIVARMG